MYTNNNSPNFTQREIDAALQIWNRAAISLLDIRHNLISPEEALRGYRLPSSAFLYTNGKAEVSLNNTVYPTNRFGLFHGGKATELTLTPTEKWLEYYLVIYKTGEPPFQKREYAKLLAQVNPFRQQYGFSPKNPLFFADQLKKIFERWKGPTPLNLFYGKADFYQFVCGVYEELEQGNVHIFEPDVVSMAICFIEANYQGNVSIQEMCDMLGISYSHFHRMFKQKTAMSPQEFLIHTRLNAARACLENSNATIREIAESCGFIDESRFYRLFMKREKLSPGRYRELSQSYMRDSAIGKAISFPYNWKNQVSPSELKGKGETFMFKQMNGEAIVAAALSLMLLFSACGTTVLSDNSDAAAAATSQKVEEQETRIVQAANGDIEVPKHPKQLVVSGFAYGDIIPFYLSNVNIGLESWADLENKSQKWHEYWGHLTNDTTLFNEMGDLESVMAMKPDIIVASTGQVAKEDAEDLQKIAPTILYDQENIDQVNNTIEKRMVFLGELFGLPDKAQGLIDEFKDKRDWAMQKMSDAGLADKKIVFIHGVENATPLIATDINQSLVYNVLGMSAPVKVDEEMFYHDGTPDDLHNAHVNSVSLEVLPQYLEDADIIIYRYFDDSEETTIDKLSKIEVWSAIPAVKSGDVLYVSNNDSLFGFSYADYMVVMGNFVDMLSQLPVVKD